MARNGIGARSWRWRSSEPDHSPFTAILRSSTSARTERYAATQALDARHYPRFVAGAAPNLRPPEPQRVSQRRAQISAFNALGLRADADRHGLVPLQFKPRIDFRF